MLFPKSNFVKSRQSFRKHLSEHIVLMKKHKFDRTAEMLELYDEELVYQNTRIRELEFKLIQAVDSRLELAKVRMVLSKSGIDLDVLMKTEEVVGE